jgi:Fic family protein
MLDRIYYTLIVDKTSIQKRTLVELLTATPLIRKHKKPTPEEKQILRFKQGLDLISQEWLVSDKPVTYKTAIGLHDYSCPGKYRKGETELKQLMNYLETNPDHPVIQAAVVYACIHRVRPFTDGNGRIASLLATLFLYKAGYDCRGLIGLEKEWLNQPVFLQEKLNLVINSAYMTGWIEFVAESLVTHLEKKLQDIKSPHPTSEKSKTFFDLNTRQQAIMSMLNEPGIKISNRDIQKQFAISQITASRDLAHLVLLGLIIPHGKGRSVYYTKLTNS